jgi:UDP-glucuronate decarboxylase
MVKRAIFDKKNILVLGGAGFIGSHLCDELVRDSKVICLDNFSSSEEINIDHLLSDPNFAFIKHNISEEINLEESPELQKFRIEFQGIQEIYNLACPMSVKDFNKNRIATIDANSVALKNALEMARKYEAKFLHFSSSVVYGPRGENNSKILENNIGKVDFLSERSSYDEGKRFSETMVYNYRTFYNMDAKIIRLFRVYGPRMRLDDNQMIPDFVVNALENEDLVIFGDSDFKTSLCYVSDVVDAAVKMMDSDLKGPVNVGSDVEINISDLAKKIIEKIGAKSKIVYEDKKIFMSRLNIPDISEIRNQLGWMPIVTLDKGIERTISDLRASKGLKSFKNNLS